MWINIDISRPLDHALEDGHEALKALDPHGPFLVGCCPKLQGPSSTTQLGKVINKSLKYVSSS